MAERTTLEIIAPTVEEALAQGLAQLGLPADAVSVEVLDSGNKGLFGLGGRQVRVRLTVNPPPGSEPVKAAKEEKPKAKREPKATKAASGPDKEAAPVSKAKPEPKAESAPVEHDPILDKTEAIISKLLFQMGMQAQVSAHYGEARDDRKPIMVDIRGGDLGVLIGRRGETLDAFQYIAALMVGKETGQFIHLVVDIEGHRDRRERQLRQLARRMAEQVIKSGRKLTLEPMPAAERRIIHMELRDHPAVTTQSAGEEPHRKITILPKD
ncbi:MAG: Jag N-terminal domain-containing protein [Chloroflexi bacterium]|nr:Jag N-terminal domain-containing protein [Chloroflexota bacterium]